MGIFGGKKKTTPLVLADQKREQAPTTTDLGSQIYGADSVIGGLGWYKARYNQVLKCLIGLALALMLSIFVNIILFLNSPSPRYFASSTDGKILELVPLDRPMLTQAGMLNWVSEAVTNTFTLDFLHWKGQLTASRDYFAPDAFKSFLESMKANGIISTIEEKRLNVSAVISRAPVIVASGIVNGRATWKIELPIIVSYESSKGVEITQRLLATVLVQRTNTATQPRGIEIKQLVLGRDTAN